MEDLAQRKKDDQGQHECEVLAPGTSEAHESARCWKRCTKNPGHPGFISAEDFALTDIPLPFRRHDVLRLVRDASALTVKLKVSYVSPDRPDNYTFSNVRGEHFPHYGTGFVLTYDTDSFPYTSEGKSYNSKLSPSSKMHFKIAVATARHVVFDTEEVKATEVSFFLDDENCVAAGRVKTLQGFKAVRHSLKDDFCIFHCLTDDQGLMEMLLDTQIPFAIPNDYLSDTRMRDNLIVIVSHPHGQPKKVTVGTRILKEVADRSTGRCRYIYRTPTCSGSSGAAVLLVKTGGFRGDPDMIWPSSISPTVHSEGLRKGYNGSAVTNPEKTLLYCFLT